MEKFLPYFPLSLVVYPQEKLNLHVFEPRYKQLIGECIRQDSTFGIPTFINKKMGQFGTEVQITKVEQTYEDGRLDISTQGIATFKVMTFNNPVPEKLYSGGLVEMIENKEETNFLITEKLINQLEELYQLLQIQLILPEDQTKISFNIAHKVGLSVEQEYELLQISSEADRQAFISEHLENAIPTIREMERTKKIIRMNGHFKNLDPLNF